MDGASKYFSVVTDTGNKMMTAALALGTKLSIAEIAVGDGGGSYYQPDPEMTELKNELWRGPINSCEVSSASENILVVKGIVPGEVGGFTIREMAVFADTGKMIAIANTPSTPKVTVIDGIINQMSLAIEIAMLNGAAINLVIDPNIVTATKADIEVLVRKIADNGKVIVGPRATELEKNDTLFVTTEADKPIKQLVRKDSTGVEHEYVVGDDNIVEMSTAFEEAKTRTNISSGEKLGTILGKIAKWFKDLKAVSFSGSYGDLIDKPTIPAGTAANYAVADNDVTNNSGYLVTARVAYDHGREIDQISSDLAIRLPGGTGIQWDGANFWGTTTAGVKKKLGDAKLNITKIGDFRGGPATQTFSCTMVPGWQSLTTDNFAVITTAAWGGTQGTRFANFSIHPTFSYNASNGILTLNDIWTRSEWNDGVDISGYINCYTVVI